MDNAWLMGDLLEEFKDIFVWSYVDMLGIDPNIVMHNIVLEHNAKPIKHKIWKMNPSITLLVKVEIKKIIGRWFHFLN